jgi:2-hydroxy-3-oxopropionate reductase
MDEAGRKSAPSQDHAGNGEPLTGAVGVIGLGQMGQPMARRLLTAGIDVVLWDLFPGPWQGLGADGAVIAVDVAEVARRAQFVLTSLPDGDALRKVALDVAQASDRSVELVIDTSTTKPAQARDIAAELRQHGVGFIDAPVSGGTTAAASGSLTFMVGGDALDVARAQPVLRHLASRVVHCGPHGAGQVAKACNQLIVMAGLEAVAESLVLAREYGLDPAKVREALLGGFAASPILEIHGDRMLRRDFAPGGKAVYNRKDIATISELALELGLILPVFTASARQLERLIEGGGGELDNAAVITVVEAGASELRIGQESRS